MLRQQNPSDVEVAITPEELEGLDEASIQALYNQRVAEERAKNAREVWFVHLLNAHFTNSVPVTSICWIIRRHPLASSSAGKVWGCCNCSIQAGRFLFLDLMLAGTLMF